MNGEDTPDDASLLFAERDVDRPILRLFDEYGRDHPWLVLTALIASGLAPLASLIPPFMLKYAVDAVLRPGDPFVLPLVPPAWLPTDQRAQLVLMAGIIIGSAAAAAGLGWSSSRAWGRFSQEVQHVVRFDVYETVQGLDVDFFENQQTGQILSILNEDVNQMNDLLERFLGDLLQIGVRFVGIAAFLFFLHWQLALVALAFVPPLVVISRYFVTRLEPKHRAVRQQVGALNARIENNLGGMKMVKVYTAEDYEAERVTEASERVRDARWDVITTRVKFFPAMDLVNWVGFGVILVVGGAWIIDGPPLFFSKPLTIGTLFSFLIYNQQFTGPMIKVGNLVDQYYDARASVIRILSLRDYDVSVAEREDAVDIAPIDGHVTLDDVTFTYDSADESTLRDVDVDVDPGSFVGIVGPTGSGKTTLTKLLLRFYDPDEGTVSIDGHDLRDVDLRSLRDAISVVSQEPYLFSGSVRENVAYGLDDVTDEEIVTATRIASAHEFVTDLPDGYDTPVGQRGVKLSGGQRQRIAIARAVLNDPDLLVLDEATSHVDNETEALIQQSLGDLIADRTTFVVAHRLSTIRHADTILVFDDGEIVERGTHEQLLEADGLYADLWRVQVGEIRDLPDSLHRTVQ